jgi:hypothetical protein
MDSVLGIVAKNQITNGGPIILIQVCTMWSEPINFIDLTKRVRQSENEYTGFAAGHSEDFTYEQQLLTAIVRPVLPYFIRSYLTISL